MSRPRRQAPESVPPRPSVVGAPAAPLKVLGGDSAGQNRLVRYQAVLSTLSGHFALVNVSPHTEKELDDHEIARLMDYLFADGEPGAAGEKLLAAVLRRRAACRAPPPSWRCLS